MRSRLCSGPRCHRGCASPPVPLRSRIPCIFDSPPQLVQFFGSEDEEGRRGARAERTRPQSSARSSSTSLRSQLSCVPSPRVLHGLYDIFHHHDKYVHTEFLPSSISASPEPASHYPHTHPPTVCGNRLGQALQELGADVASSLLPWPQHRWPTRLILACQQRWVHGLPDAGWLLV